MLVGEGNETLTDMPSAAAPEKNKILFLWMPFIFKVSKHASKAALTILLM